MGCYAYQRKFIKLISLVRLLRKKLIQIQSTYNEAVAKIKDWLTTSSLQLAGEKTEAVTLDIGDHSVNTLNSLRYLRVMVDARLNFKAQIEKACSKAAFVTTALTRVMAL